jgi:hypothetical protein
LRIYKEPGNKGTIFGYLLKKERRKGLDISDTGGNRAKVISL